MKVDPYTRLILTVIAAALLYLCVVLTPVGTPLSARQFHRDPPTHVVIEGWVDDGNLLHALPRRDSGQRGPLPLPVYETR